MLAEGGKLRAWGLLAGAGLAAAGFILSWRARRVMGAGTGGGGGAGCSGWAGGGAECGGGASGWVRGGAECGGGASGWARGGAEAEEGDGFVAEGGGGARARTGALGGGGASDWVEGGGGASDRAGAGGGAGGCCQGRALPMANVRPVGVEELLVPGSGPQPRSQEMLDYLDSIHGCLESLRAEVHVLRECVQVAVDRAGSGGGRSARRTRGRGWRDSGEDSADSASIYFAASSGKAGSDSGSEAGYATAHTETEVEEIDTELETQSPQDTKASSPPLDLKLQESVQLSSMSEFEDEGLNSLLQEADRLHQGSHEDKKEGFNTLRDNKAKFGNSEEFCWRMIRAFSDMFQITEDEEAQKSYALAGRDEAAVSLQDHGDSTECHKWLAVVSSYLQSQDTGDKSVECAGNLHKEQILKQVALQQDSPAASDTLERWNYSDKQLQEKDSVLAEVLKTYESMCSNEYNTTAENFPITNT